MLSKTHPTLAILLLLASLVFADLALVRRQGNNEVYPGNEAQMTGASNATLHLLPVKKEIAQKLAGGRELLKPTGLPDGYLKDDEHLLLVNSAYMSDIRMLDLRVDRLLSTNVQVPFVDQLKDGKTPFRIFGYIFMDTLIPPLVGSLTQGFVIIPSTFDPADAPYRSVGDGKYASAVFTGIDNQIPVIGGPGPLHPIFQANFKRVNKGRVPVSTYKSLLKQPVVHSLFNTCSTEKDIFNNDQANPFFVQGTNIQTYPPITPAAQTFRNTDGYSLSLQWIAPAGPGSQCSTFAA